MSVKGVGPSLGACGGGAATTGGGPAWLGGAWIIGARGPQVLLKSEIGVVVPCDTGGGLARVVAAGRGGLCSTGGSGSANDGLV